MFLYNECFYLGNVWSCGKNAGYGILGVGHPDESQLNRELFAYVAYEPLLIRYFMENEIRIVDIVCGNDFCMALDINGRIYTWGRNSLGCCGICKFVAKVYMPTLVEALSEYKVVEIKCGYHHSYCKTECGQHYVWGSNSDQECIVDTKRKNICKPQRVDELVLKQSNIKEILAVYPGYYNTKMKVLLNNDEDFKWNIKE